VDRGFWLTRSFFSKSARYSEFLEATDIGSNDVPDGVEYAVLPYLSSLYPIARTISTGNWADLELRCLTLEEMKLKRKRRGKLGEPAHFIGSQKAIIATLSGNTNTCLGGSWDVLWRLQSGWDTGDWLQLPPQMRPRPSAPMLEMATDYDQGWCFANTVLMIGGSWPLWMPLALGVDAALQEERLPLDNVFYTEDWENGNNRAPQRNRNDIYGPTSLWLASKDKE
jgi:hypothetical protein